MDNINEETPQNKNALLEKQGSKWSYANDDQHLSRIPLEGIAKIVQDGKLQICGLYPHSETTNVGQNRLRPTQKKASFLNTKNRHEYWKK